ncbi:hypothetical protein M23134_06994 [Microscilla marina ATCC 23134]|uniref:Uncharacterized protein n=1 Tax=Microscilla marina ATCC 23134 TaxID=313606 RepID=A1ZT11_MICM2|nr:hypothetical protein M23134_06994 [Microscilla marina ATCC 23134]
MQSSRFRSGMETLPSEGKLGAGEAGKLINEIMYLKKVSDQHKLQ